MKYTHGHGPAVLANHVTRTAQDSMAFVLPYLHRDSRVLDVGCGPGSITLDLAAAIAGEGGAASQVIGVENTPAPVAAAEELARRRGIGAVFMTGDVQALPFQDATFDVVVAHQVLQHLGDPVGALRECARVAAPTASSRCGTPITTACSSIHSRRECWNGSVTTGVGHGPTGGEPDAGRHLPEWARAAGFGPGQITFSTTTWQYSAGAGASWLADNWIRRTRESGAVPADATDRICAGWRTWSEDEAAVFVMPHGELLIRV